MRTFIETLYRDYCLARLQEMRKLEISHWPISDTQRYPIAFAVLSAFAIAIAVWAAMGQPPANQPKNPALASC